jgi:hypothetical protein
LTEVSVKVLEPSPLEVAEDMVRLVAVIVKLGVAASAGEPKNATLNVTRAPRTTSKRYLLTAETFLRAACALPFFG